jgi:predicted transcriptional regulator
MRVKSSDFTFNAKDREILDLMMSLGMAKNISKTLVFLSKTAEASSSDIEGSIDLRQSEVSISVNWLRNKGWVASRTIRKPGKGRPAHMYKLRYSLRRIAREIGTTKNEEMEDIRKKIAHLKRLAK